jgi:predicted RNase H-like nuclease (RuvC/YqgF family)
MNTLVRTLEKVLELERKERNQRSRRTREHRKFDDAERDALAARLEGLHRQWQLEQAEPGLAAGEREEPEP